MNKLSRFWRYYILGRYHCHNCPYSWEKRGYEDADLKGADLRGADLTGTTLVETDLKGADLDYSCLPLWCGSLYAHFDDRQLKQIAYHIVKAGLYSKNVSPETKRELAKLIDFANGFHRVDECGEIEWEEKNE